MSILSRAARTFPDKGPEATETKDVGARDHRLESDRQRSGRNSRTGERDPISRPEEMWAFRKAAGLTDKREIFLTKLIIGFQTGNERHTPLRSCWPPARTLACAMAIAP